MATTRLISMHQNKGKSIAQCLSDRTDYVQNPDKTKPTYTVIKETDDATEEDTVEPQLMIAGWKTQLAMGRNGHLRKPPLFTEGDRLHGIGGHANG